MLNKTDYNKIASTYNQRYEINNLDGIDKALNKLVKKYKPNNLLEAGCGTGRWLSELSDKNVFCIGLDRSVNMMNQTRGNNSAVQFVNGDAVRVPIKNSTFDFVYCVNAIHHFGSTLAFISEVKRILTKDGILAIIGFDPNEEENDWYVYNYFESTLDKDLARYPSWEQLIELSTQLGFSKLDFTFAESIYRTYKGSDVFNDPFLLKHNTSQLASLSEQEYSLGIENIKVKIECDPETIFVSKFFFRLLLLQINL
ncbi:MAG: class I SAM-dependent methyltransferase [Ignavibacteriales bacterium]|nr:MAG: class I SAM-dependent methyltransferase [Ignavibacteriales bacterium]